MIKTKARDSALFIDTTLASIEDEGQSGDLTSAAS
jgi:hypothetical protein